MRENGEALVGGLGIAKGLKVLELGCGDGTTALPAAKLGADVLGVDIAKNLGGLSTSMPRRRLSRPASFRKAMRAICTNGTIIAFFVVSIFGAMFAPKPLDVAKELVRLTQAQQPDCSGNWVPNDPTLVAQILKVSPFCSPPPPELH
jgi:hypothetical protein